MQGLTADAAIRETKFCNVQSVFNTIQKAVNLGRFKTVASFHPNARYEVESSLRQAKFHYTLGSIDGETGFQSIAIWWNEES
jgi:hypothetical protein